MNRIADVLVRWRTAAAALATLLLVAAGALSRLPPVDGSLRSFEIAGNRYQELGRRAAEHFPTPSAAQIRITPAQDSTVGTLVSDLGFFEADLGRALPGSRLVSLHTALPALVHSGVSLADPASSALARAADLELVSRLVSRDRRSFLALMYTEDGTVPEPSVLDSLLADRPASFSSVNVFSLAHLERDLRRAIGRDTALLTALGLLAAIPLLLWAFGSARAVVVVAANALAGVLVGLATLSVLSLPINVATMLVIPTVAALSTADVVHLLAGFKAAEGSARPQDGARSALERYVFPALLTSLTTSLAFLSLCFSEAEALRWLGVAGAVAVMLTWVIVFSLTPWLLVTLRPHLRPGSALGWALRAADRATGPAGALLVGLLLLSPIAFARLDFGTPLDHFFPRGAPVTVTREAMIADFPTLTPLHVLLEAEGPGDQASRSELAALAVEVGARASVLDGVVDVTTAEAAARGSGLAVTPRAPWLRLVPDNSYASADGRWQRIEVRVATSANTVDVARTLEALLEDLRPAASVGLASPLLDIEYVNEVVVGGLLRSFLFSMAVLTLVMLPVTGSLRGALAAGLVNAVPLGAAVCLFGLLGLELSVLSACVFVLALGVIVDDTIHALYRLTSDPERFDEVAESLVITTLALGLAFLFFVVSAFEPVRSLGGAMACVLFIALVADLTLLPRLVRGRPGEPRG